MLLHEIKETAMSKGTILNRTPSVLGIMTKDGKDMIYLKSREKIDLDKYKLDQHHVDNMIKSGCLTILGGEVKKVEVSASVSASATSSKSEVHKEKPKEFEKTEADTKKSKH